MRFEVEFDREQDGRWIAEIASLPGAMAYGETRERALAAVQAIALRVLADRLENQHESLKTSVQFVCVNIGPSIRAELVLDALKKIGWAEAGQAGAHCKLARSGYPDYIWAFSDSEQIDPKMLSRIIKHTGPKHTGIKKVELISKGS